MKSIEKKNDSAVIAEDIVLEGSGETEESLYDEMTKPVEQWNLDMIGAKNVSENSDHVKVAVIDTGVCASSQIHVVDRINLVPGEEEVDPLYEDVSGHGTSVASIIGAVDDGRSIRGVNPNAEIYSVKALSDGESAPLSRIIEGIYWCIDKDVDIINMSFGTHTNSPLLYQAIKDADEAGILMIAAAGNSREDGVEYPAAYNEVIAVGSVDNNADISDFSAIGKSVELVAPGEEIAATGFFDEVVKTQGTSVSTAHVTGVASLLWEQNTNKSAEFIRGLLTDSAKSLGDEDIYGSGIVDAEYALTHYEEYEQEYSESDNESETDALNNNEDIATYTDDEVKALWSGDAHKGAVNYFNKYAYNNKYTDAKLKLMRYAVKMPDDDLREIINEFFHYIDPNSAAAIDANHYFHGYGNYVANYMFLAYCARYYKIKKALPSTESAWLQGYPVSTSNGCHGKYYETLKNGLTALNNNWSKIYNTYLINEGFFNEGEMNESKGHNSIILIGIAIHCAMDAYSHSAVRNNSTEFFDSDDKSDCRERIDQAKAVAVNILTKWEQITSNSTLDNAVKFQLSEFYHGGAKRLDTQQSIDTNAFKLNNLLEFVTAVKPNLVNISATKYNWFASRSINIGCNCRCKDKRVNVPNKLILCNCATLYPLGCNCLK